MSGTTKEAPGWSVSSCWSSSRVCFALPNFRRASALCQWLVVAGWYLLFTFTNDYTCIRCSVMIFSNKKYVLSNLESVQCNFFIFDHVTFIHFKICCLVQNFIKIGYFFTELWRYNDFQNGGRPPSWNCFTTIRDHPRSLLLAAAVYQILCQSDT